MSRSANVAAANPAVNALNARAPAEIRAAEAAEAERELREMEAEQQYAKSIQTRDIPWASYEQNGLITNNELTLVLEFDKNNNAEEIQKLLQDKGSAYAALFLKCLDTIRTKETTEYVIVLIDTLLTSSNPAPASTPNLPKVAATLNSFLPYPRAQLFHSLLPNVDIFAPFTRLILNSAGIHAYIVARIQHILAILLSTLPETTQEPAEGTKTNPSSSMSAKTFMKYLANRLTTEQPGSRAVLSTLSALKIALRNDSLATIFAAEDGIKALAVVLGKESGNAQLIYSVGFNLWLLSYKSSNCAQMSQHGIFRRTIAILKVSVMEKVIRILSSVIRNAIDDTNKPALSQGEDAANARAVSEECIGLGLLPVAETLSKRKYKDTDILPDIEAITSILTDTVKRLSTFDLYSSEVQSGNLSWTPAHTNEIFWRENIVQFEDRNYKLIGRLIELLADEDDAVREIACHDLGEYARFAPEGKRVISKLGGKAKLMANLQHKNAKVAKAALLATQKLMVANWEYLAKNSAGGVASLVSKGGAQKA